MRAAHAVWNKRVPTGELNRWFEDALERHQPPLVDGRRLKLRYITQAKARPPTFMVFGTRAEQTPEDYSALSGEQPARDVRSARHADPAAVARDEEPVRDVRRAAPGAGCRRCFLTRPRIDFDV